MSPEIQRMSEDRLDDIEQAAARLSPSWWQTAALQLVREVRRLQQRERDLLTAVHLNEGTIQELQEDIDRVLLERHTLLEELGR